MSFFKRNKNGPLIPPVSAPEPKADPYASQASNQGDGGGDPYARNGGGGGGGGVPYARGMGNGGGMNPYARDAPNPDDAARNELFSGYNAPEKPKAAKSYGYEGREEEEDFDEDEEIEGIKQDMRGIKQESLASTRWVGVWF